MGLGHLTFRIASGAASLSRLVGSWFAQTSRLAGVRRIVGIFSPDERLDRRPIAPVDWLDLLSTVSAHHLLRNVLGQPTRPAPASQFLNMARSSVKPCAGSALLPALDGPQLCAISQNHSP